jgi:hypothetical protein
MYITELKTIGFCHAARPATGLENFLSISIEGNVADALLTGIVS